MGLFDSFFTDNGTSGMVPRYVKGMDRNTLIRSIETEYRNAKGSCKYTPQMGEYGSFEFAGALLLWKFCKENLRSDMEKYGSLMIMLADMIGCAFNCMSPGEWSDRIDNVINRHNDVLSYTEWSEIYNYLKHNFAYEIHKMEFNEGKMSERQRYEIYTKFMGVYNSYPDFASVINYYAQQGMGLKRDIPFRIDN